MADKYKQSLRSIEKQEFAVEKLQNKLKEISNSDKVPQSIKNLVGETEKAEKELLKLKQQIDSLNSKKEVNKREITRQKGIIASSEYEDTLENRLAINNADSKIQVFNAENKNMDLQIEKIKKKYDLLETKIYDNKNAISSAKEELRTTSTDALNKELDLANQKLEDAKEKAIKLKEEFDNSKKIKFASFFGGGIDEVGKKIDKFKNKMSRLIGTAMIFSLIRNQLTSLRNGFISLLKTDDQFSSSLNQIKANLMTAFAPIYNACLPAINSLMNSLSKVTGTIAVFMANLFGTNIKDATKDAQKLSGALNKTASSAKKASGALGSFDTLEVLPEESSGGGTSGVNSNSIDYSGELTYSQRLLDFMNKIKDVIVTIWDYGTKHKELVIDIVKWAVILFATNKVISFVKSFEPLAKTLKGISNLFIKIDKDGSKSFNKVGTGVTLAITGFLVMIKNVTNLIKNWDKLDSKQKIIKVGMAALGVAAIALGYAIAAGISAATLGIGAIIGLIATLLTALATLTISFLTEKDAILSTKDAQEQLNQAHENYVNANESYINSVDNAKQKMQELEEAERQTGLSGADLNECVQNGTLSYSDMTEAQKKVYKAYINNQSAQEKLKEATDTLTSAKKEEMMASFANQLAIAAETGNYEDYKKSVVTAYNEGKISASEARDLIEQSMSRMSDASQKTFMEDLPTDISNGMDPDRYKTKGQKLKEWFSETCSKIGSFFTKLFTETIPQKLNELKEKLKTFFTKTVPNTAITGVELAINSIISLIEGLINKPIRAINKIISSANEIPGIDIRKFSEVKLGRVSIPKLARGAVIPPRQEFAAILGDQKHGTNIEAPLETIKQANREVLEEVLGRIGLNNEEKEIVLKNWQFVLQFGNTTLGKMVIEEIKKYQKETNIQFLLA